MCTYAPMEEKILEALVNLFGVANVVLHLNQNKNYSITVFARTSIQTYDIDYYNLKEKESKC